jgi:hypothetical protein
MLYAITYIVIFGVCGIFAAIGLFLTLRAACRPSATGHTRHQPKAGMAEKNPSVETPTSARINL